MNRSSITSAYFDWMCALVDVNKCQYNKLMHYLHRTDFDVRLAMDENRANDGVELRYRFGFECGYDQSIICAYLDDRPCSILEMMVALAMRCEENIMDDPDVGNRTGEWFWTMIQSLGLNIFAHNCDFNIDKVEYIAERFLERKYESNGKGGLFIINNCERDLRTVEIWNQMCWYLDSIIE